MNTVINTALVLKCHIPGDHLCVSSSYLHPPSLYLMSLILPAVKKKTKTGLGAVFIYPYFIGIWFYILM